MAQIDASALTRIYASDAGPVPALRGVDLTIAPGAYLAIMGPSGSGKTTLMNLLGLLDSPTGGHLSLEGRDVTHLSADARAAIRNSRIGFVFQNYSLLPRWTAIENVELPLVYAGLRPSERLGRAQEMLAAVGLGHRMEHWPTRLSGGEQQRVAIARAMVTRPALVLADEPTGALDSETGAQIMGVLRRFNEMGTTIVLVTHDPKVAAEASRTVRMRDGRFEPAAPPPVAPDRAAAGLRA
jgi:putative ABC transport system ATP-binding protein